MMNLKVIQTVTSVITALRPFAFAMIGGMVVAGVQRCSNKPVQLVITNQQYENQLQDIRTKQEVLSNSLPSIDSSLLYLSKRYK